MVEPRWTADCVFWCERRADVGLSVFFEESGKLLQLGGLKRSDRHGVATGAYIAAGPYNRSGDSLAGNR